MDVFAFVKSESLVPIDLAPVKEVTPVEKGVSKKQAAEPIVSHWVFAVCSVSKVIPETL
jgi:hypothetical protein